MHTESKVLIYLGSGMIEYVSENKEYKGVEGEVLLDTLFNLEEEVYHIRTNSQVKVHNGYQKTTMTALKETLTYYSPVTEVSKNQTQRLKCSLNTTQI